jgi:glycosyl transferase, family 25
MRLLDYFERAYVINLPQRADRRRAMQRELGRVGMPFAPGKVELFSALRPAAADGWPSIGARGCFLSHLRVLKRAQASRLANVLVMEDDLAFADSFVDVQARLVDQLQSTRWGFVYLGHPLQRGWAGDISLEPWSQPLLTAHFYGVDATILDRLIDFLDAVRMRPPGHPDGGPMHVDGAYSTFRMQNPDVLTFLAVPSLGRQRSSRSDITASWFDRLPLLKQLAGFARAIRPR